MEEFRETVRLRQRHAHRAEREIKTDRRDTQKGRDGERDRETHTEGTR